jgi:hypothetical protein
LPITNTRAPLVTIVGAEKVSVEDGDGDDDVEDGDDEGPWASADPHEHARTIIVARHSFDAFMAGEIIQAPSRRLSSVPSDWNPNRTERGLAAAPPSVDLSREARPAQGRTTRV